MATKERETNQGQTTESGKLLLVKLWNENRKSTNSVIKDRAIKMLFGAFESPQEMVSYFKEHKIEYVERL